MSGLGLEKIKFRWGLVWGSLILAFLLYCFGGFSSDAEISVRIGEPWEDMQKRSTAVIGAPIKGRNWFRMPGSDARLRFFDEHYGFVTPVGRFFVVSFHDDGSVRSIDMSPQTQPLSLDEALQVVTDLQRQWVTSGWKILHPDSFPAISDTPEWRARIRESWNGKDVYWRAEEKYQITISVRTFGEEGRYMITLSLSEPW